jgi:MFS family permease
LLSSGLSHDLVWRLLLAFGAIPAMSVFQMRRHMAESPRYLLATGQHEDAHAASGHVLGESHGAVRDGKRPKQTSFAEGFVALTRRRDLAMRLIGASAAWFLMDFAYYGNTVSSPLVLHAVAPNESLITETLTQLAVFAIAAVPGYFVAAAMMDRMGRKTIQIMGFAMMALSFAAIAAIPGIEKLIYPFLIVYGISYFFTEFGPNATTFVYPAELFPVEGRTTGHGVASAAGKLGGFTGVFLFPILLSAGGLIAAESSAAVVSVLGILVTIFMLPETKGKSLEELSAEEAGPKGAAAPIPA